jgi:hypothetical protein
MKYIADRIADAGYRACVYDRLGYGWTPSHLTMSDASVGTSSAEILSLVLEKAGEKGPYVCVGHSAGADKCLRFAATSSNVKGIAFLDGYPDIIRAGNFRPGKFKPNPAMVNALKLFTLFLGSTGLTRGMVGRTEASFASPSLVNANLANYAQNRFWFAQYWDVAADVGSGDNGYTFKLLNGTQTDKGIVTYGRNLNVTVGVFPAYVTVTPVNCTTKPDDFCCQGAKDTPMCLDIVQDKAIYLEQANLYANSIGIQPGVMQVAPAGSDHGYPYSLPHADWLVSTLLSNF